MVVSRILPVPDQCRLLCLIPSTQSGCLTKQIKVMTKDNTYTTFMTAACELLAWAIQESSSTTHVSKERRHEIIELFHLSGG